MSFGKKKKRAPATPQARTYEPSNYGNFQSGFRPYPASGFMIQPAGNYWDGNDFYMPGINPSQPTMRSMLQMPGEMGAMGKVMADEPQINPGMPMGMSMGTPQGPSVGGFNPQALMEMSAGAGQPSMDPRQMMLSRLKG